MYGLIGNNATALCIITTSLSIAHNMDSEGFDVNKQAIHFRAWEFAVTISKVEFELYIKIKISCSLDRRAYSP